MTASNRAARIGKMFKVLKKHYKPLAAPTDRSVLEHLLYACCLENARFEAADEALAKLQQSYFDWNEVRVSTVAELTETLASLPDTVQAASRLKRCLQAIFESYYSFDIDFLRKQNIGKAVKELQKHDGVTPYGVAYVTQHGLGGHAVPANRGALDALVVLEIINDADAKKEHVPGMERAVSKSKGVECASLLQQFGADYFASPFSPRIRAIFAEIDPDSKSRLPKRAGKDEDEGPPSESSHRKKGARGQTSSTAAKKSAGRNPPAEPPDKSGSPNASNGAKKTASKRITKKKPR